MNAAFMIVLRVELTANEAAALARLCSKFVFTDAAAYLYPHVPKSVREEQAEQMVRATSAVAEALSDAGVHGWPWIETGNAQ